MSDENSGGMKTSDIFFIILLFLGSLGILSYLAIFIVGGIVLSVMMSYIANPFVFLPILLANIGLFYVNKLNKSSILGVAFVFAALYTFFLPGLIGSFRITNFVLSTVCAIPGVNIVCIFFDFLGTFLAALLISSISGIGLGLFQTSKKKKR